ncbi:hypothetical protein BJX99DRAFT_41060 [Aspergillus californicus]
MCFYNQKKFACDDYRWTNFVHRCEFESRQGETCGMKFVSTTEILQTNCRICEKIETKCRRRDTEKDRVARWQREGGILVASIDKSQGIIADLEREIKVLQQERNHKKKQLI